MTTPTASSTGALPPPRPQPVPPGGRVDDVADPRRWVALGVVLSAAFMVLLDISIVNTAIPSIQRNLGASNAEIQFVIAGYQLAYAVLLITGGRLGDIFGRKRLFTVGMAGFTAASALCGLAPTAEVLVAARILQGAMASLMYPQVLSVIQVSFPPRERGAAFGVFGAVIGVASITGPLAGGILIGDDLSGGSWRRIFLVNVPVGLLALLAAWALLRESRAPHAPHLDTLGVLVVSLGLFLLTYPLVEGREAGWPTWAWGMLAASVPVLVAFVLLQRWEATRARGSPLVELSLFGIPSFTVGVCVSLLFVSGIPAFFLVFSLTLQIGLGFTPLHAGLTTIPFAVGSVAGSALSARVARTLGPRILQLGCFILGLGLVGVLVTVSARGHALRGPELIPALSVSGFGLGCVIAPLVTVVLGGVPPRHAGSASGIVTTGQQIGGALGVAVIGVIFFGLLGSRADAATAAVVPRLEQQLLAAGIPAPAIPAVIADFRSCFHDRASSNDPAMEPPSCHRFAGLAADRPGSAAAAVLGEAARSALAGDFLSAFQRSLACDFAVVVASGLLVFALPRGAARSHEVFSAG